MAIADRITEMYTHVGDVYDTITNVDLPTNKNIQNIPQTIKDSYLEIMNNGIDTIWNNWEKVTGEGTSLTLNNTEQAPMKNELKGNTYQTQYSGKNLLPPTIATETKNGITLTNNGDGSYTLTGIYSSTTEFSIDLPTTLNGTYSFSGNNPASSKNIQFRILKSSGSPWSTYLNTVNSISENQTIENGTEQGIRIVGSFTSGFTLKPQLESGSTATSYEPYVGGVAVPNPTSPIPVNVVSGDNEIVVNNKNFLKIPSSVSRTYNGLTFSVNNDGSVSITGTSTSAGGFKIPLDVPIPMNDNYCFSLKTVGTISTLDGQQWLLRNSSNTQLLAPAIRSDATTYSARNINDTATQLEIYTRNNITLNCTIYPQLELGSTYTSYEAFQGNTYNIDLPVENLINLSTITENKRIGSNGTPYTDNSYDLSDYIEVQPNTIYTYSRGITGGGSFAIAYYDSTQTFISRTMPLIPTSSTSGSVTTPSNAKYARITDLKTIINQIQFEKGSKANSYTPYGTTPIELCKIPNTNYEDNLFHDKTTDKWYWHREAGKVVLNGTEPTWARADGNDNYRDFRISITDIALANTDPIGYIDNRFAAKTSSYWNENGEHLVQMNDKRLSFRIAVSRLTDSTRESWISWLTNNHITTYYALATPTNTEITYQPLIDQLNELEKAISYENQTNISQINNDLGFIISASALKKDDVTSNNNISLLMSVEESPNTNVEEEIDEEPIEEIETQEEEE